MVGMTFDEQHPRGQATNAGQFRAKTNDAPAGELRARALLPERLAGNLRVTVDESVDSDTGAGPSTLRRSLVTGPLADRIRARLPFADRAAPIILTEETERYGTEWTREVSTTFEVRVGEWSETFHPDTGDLAWADLNGPGGRSDSVFARFDAWLRAGESPVALRDEWFDTAGVEECDWWVRYRARPDTLLWRAARRRARGRLAGINLEMVPATARTDRFAKLTADGAVAWRVDLLGETRADEFTPILERIDLNWIGSTRDTGAVIGAVTDRFMAGGAGY